MGDDEYSLLFNEVAEGLLDGLLTLGVKGGGGFVQDKDGGVT